MLKSQTKLREETGSDFDGNGNRKLREFKDNAKSKTRSNTRRLIHLAMTEGKGPDLEDLLPEDWI